MSSFAFFRGALLTAVSSPLGCFLLASALVLALSGEWMRRWRRRLLALLLILFALSCTDLFGRGLLLLVESFAPSSPEADRSRAAVALVPGGGAVAEGNLYQPSVSSQRRLRRAREVLRFFPDGMLLISGIESPLMARWLGMKKGECLLEKRSVNTRGNIRECAKLLRRRYPGVEARPQVLIVTDRFHMARTMCWADVYLKGFEVVPMPAASLVRRRTWQPLSLLPTCRGLEMTSMAWREVLALSRDLIRAKFTEVPEV